MEKHNRKMNSSDKALVRLSMMSDWQELQNFNAKKLLKEIEQFKDDWKPYNPKKPNNRFGLSVTSIDGGLSGIPDLTSLRDYELQTGKKVQNIDLNVPTEVYKQSEELQTILEPFKPWLTRSHFLRIDRGGFFPDHFDVAQAGNYANDEIRLIGLVNANEYQFKWIYDDKIINKNNGSLWYCNVSKRHSVFSTLDGMILLIICLGHWEEKLFSTLLDQAKVK